MQHDKLDNREKMLLQNLATPVLQLVKPLQFTANSAQTKFDCRLTSGSGASTYPADRDFKGHVGGVRPDLERPGGGGNGICALPAESRSITAVPSGGSMLTYKGPVPRGSSATVFWRGRSSFPFSSIYSFPSKKVKKVGDYPIERTPQSQELPPPLASARGHGVLAFAKIVSTSNIGLESKLIAGTNTSGVGSRRKISA